VSFEYLSFSEFLGNLFGFKFSCFARSFLELFYGASDIQEILFASVERMAVVANFNMEFLFSGTRVESVAASTYNLGISKISWVEFFFHTDK
jgi:hypothetical protein